MSDAPRRPSKFPVQLQTLRSPARPVRTGAAAPARKAASAGEVAVAAPRPVLRPQQPLQQAHRDAARGQAPSGLGLDSADVRARMAHRVRAAGVSNEVLLQALASVPRHLFVDPALVTQAYEDTSLPIGHGQTISKPSVVARMIDLLSQGQNARRGGTLGVVLEIGTGCGYQAALLARMARQVISVERLRALHDKARELLATQRPDNLRLVFADGMLGHPPNAPYDSIIAAAGGQTLPQAWLDQLAVGGRLVTPMASEVGGGQVLVVLDRTEQGYTRSVFEAVRFVPLKSGLGA